jgi:hypothetical protein
MQEISIHDALIIPKTQLIGKTVIFNNWQAVSFHIFKSVIDWLNANFEYTLTPVGDSIQFFIIAALPLAHLNTNHAPAPQLTRWEQT